MPKIFEIEAEILASDKYVSAYHLSFRSFSIICALVLYPNFCSLHEFNLHSRHITPFLARADTLNRTNYISFFIGSKSNGQLWRKQSKIATPLNGRKVHFPNLVVIWKKFEKRSENFECRNEILWYVLFYFQQKVGRTKKVWKEVRIFWMQKRNIMICTLLLFAEIWPFWAISNVWWFEITASTLFSSFFV